MDQRYSAPKLGCPWTHGDTERGRIGCSQGLGDIGIAREIFENFLPCLQSNSQVRLRVLICLDEIVICTFEPVQSTVRKLKLKYSIIHGALEREGFGGYPENLRVFKQVRNQRFRYRLTGRLTLFGRRWYNHHNNLT